MKNNWILQEMWSSAKIEDDYDDYGCGEDHEVSIGDEVESLDRAGNVHAGVVVGIIRDIDGVPVCYKIWDGERNGFDYIQGADSIVCEPCGSSQWALERIGYVRFNHTDKRGYYLNNQTGDVIYW